MLVSEAAKKLGISTQTLRLALRQGLFSFGAAVQTSENRYTYYINPKRLERYLNAEDVQDGGNCATCTDDYEWVSPRRQFS